MSKKFTKPLDNLETLSSLDFITTTTLTNLFTHQPRYLQIPTKIMVEVLITILKQQ